MSIRRIPALVLAITLLALLYGGTAAWAVPGCPLTSPNFTPDFSSNGALCLTLNDAAAFGVPASSLPTVPPPPYSPPGSVNPPAAAPANVNTVLRLTPNSNFTSGSAWFNTAQPVSGPFSTTFTFQLSGANTVDGPADGIAFVIQNSALTALGPGGCGIGFGDSSSGCTPSTGGIPNSLAVEFNTFMNSGIDPNNNDVTIQNCSGTGANSVDPSCKVAINSTLLTAGTVSTNGTTTVTWVSGSPFNTSWAAGTEIFINGSPFTIASVASTTSLTVNGPAPPPLAAASYSVPITLADGNVHSVTITYSGSGTKLLDVILDNVDLFPGGVTFDMTTIGLTSGNAWVGFTAATGGGDDNQDILSWTFTPQAQTAVLSTTSTATLSFPNAAGNTVYDYTAILTQPYANPELQVQPMLMTPAQCDSLVDRSFAPARCFVYDNAENSGMAASVVFAVTCPASLNGVCGSNEQGFFATLGTDFQFVQSENPLFVYPGIAGLLNPFPGFLKGVGPNPASPCAAPAHGPLFTSNQVQSFVIDGGHTIGSSGGGASCWVATYDTPGELPPGIKVTSPTVTTYTQNQSVTASYTCNNPITSKPVSSATGPYLTVASCTQNQLPVPNGFNNNGACTPSTNGLACMGSVDTSILGPHVFTVTAIDSGGNQSVFPVVYTVKKH